MDNTYDRYILFREIIAVFNRGFEGNVFVDADDHIYDAVLDRMDLLWHSLAKKEKENLRNG